MLVGQRAAWSGRTSLCRACRAAYRMAAGLLWWKWVSSVSENTSTQSAVSAVLLWMSELMSYLCKQMVRG